MHPPIPNQSYSFPHTLTRWHQLGSCSRLLVARSLRRRERIHRLGPCLPNTYIYIYCILAAARLSATKLGLGGGNLGWTDIRRECKISRNYYHHLLLRLLRKSLRGLSLSACARARYLSLMNELPRPRREGERGRRGEITGMSCQK